jgi:hypothetical protein
MHALGGMAFDPRLTPEAIFRAGAEVRDDEAREVFQDFAADLIEIQSLPEFTGERS